MLKVVRRFLDSLAFSRDFYLVQGDRLLYFLQYSHSVILEQHDCIYVFSSNWMTDFLRTLFVLIIGRCLRRVPLCWSVGFSGGWFTLRINDQIQTLQLNPLHHPVLSICLIIEPSYSCLIHLIFDLYSFPWFAPENSLSQDAHQVWHKYDM